MADQGSAGAIPEEIIEQSRVFAKIDLHGLRQEEAMKLIDRTIAAVRIQAGADNAEFKAILFAGR